MSIRGWRVVLVTAACAALSLVARPAEAQLGSLLSPGPLTRAHTKLEGVSQCTQCHERGQRVAADRCLSCHKPVAQRIAAKVGIHRGVTDDCVTCHVEHHGLDGELRPFNREKFSHTTDTRFPLDGKHAPLAAKCESCHKTRSFLEVKTTCEACHDDVHKGSLGRECQQCHPTSAAFAAAKTSFDHGRTKFALTGAHATADCATCHKNGAYTGLKFASCANCHETPHPKTVAGACTSCHTTATWTTKKFTHASTDFPLAGKHADVACASCHKGPPLAVKTPFSTCATCHADPHKGEFTEDCDGCHTEKGFTGGTFDHAAKTTFPLTAGHANVACTACHTGIVLGRTVAKTAADFRGADTDCVSCHADPHQRDLGGNCTSCHDTTTFAVTHYTHSKSVDLIAGRHSTLACTECHVPAPLVTSRAKVAMAGGTFSTTPTACATCHEDVHRGEVGTDCVTCHSVNAERFAADRFDHARSTFTLTGAHATAACEACHVPGFQGSKVPGGEGATGSGFQGARGPGGQGAKGPGGQGGAAAWRLKGIGTSCRSCHEDVHLGQVAQACEQCHDTKAFTIANYTHRKKDPQFFVGAHLTAECTGCHTRVTGKFPAASGTAVNFKVRTDCVGCHADVHRGSMGRDCRACHQITGRLGTRREARP